MARQTTSLDARLRKLESAKARAAKLGPKVTLASKPMAEILGVTWNVLRDWCNEIEGFDQSGAFDRGGNGIEWTFRPRKTVAFLIAHFRARLAGQARKSRAITKAVGVQLPAEESAPSMAETKDLVNLTVTIVSAAERQRQYVPADDVISFVAGYNQKVLDGILGVRTKVDPNGNLPAHVRASIDQHLRSVATSVHAQAAQFIEEHRTGAGIQQGGTG
jgi:hypothetical protein